jgi:uncharacterized protein YdeI (YjbR/CyaY-like superfamily)
MNQMPPRFFPTPTEWREWLEVNHAKVAELVVSFHKRDSGRACMTWSESVDEALCFGWIDAVRRSVDQSSYTIRFCPRKSGSIWSNVNIAKAEGLIKAGRMRPAGLAKYQSRTAAKSGVYAFEQGELEFDPASRKQFRASAAAWKFFQAQPASYRQKLTWRVINAKLPETRKKRLALLIKASSDGKRL